MAQDILDELIPLDGDIDSKEIYDRLYKDHPFFKDFPYNKPRYDERIKSTIVAVKRTYKWAAYDNKAVAKDLEKYPPNEGRWDGSAAQRLLKEDFDDNKHLAYAKPSDFRETRPEYKLFTKVEFRKHVDQEKQSRKVYKGGANKRYTKRVIGDKSMSRKVTNS